MFSSALCRQQPPEPTLSLLYLLVSLSTLRRKTIVKAFFLEILLRALLRRPLRRPLKDEGFLFHGKCPMACHRMVSHFSIHYEIY